MLAVPSPAIASMVRHDPLGLYDLLREQLGGAQAGINLGVTEGGYVASDLRSRLLIAKPAQPPFDADFSRALMTRLDALRGEMSRHAAEPERRRIRRRNVRRCRCSSPGGIGLPWKRSR